MSGLVGLDLGVIRVPQVEVTEQAVMPRKRQVPARSDDWVDGEFLRGPIPLDWLGRACQLPGRTPLAVALAIWFVRGLRNCDNDLALTTAVVARFGVSNRTAKSRALEELEGAGLIRVKQLPGKNPRVTIVR